MINKLQQLKLDFTEAIVESVDGGKKDMREIKYAVDKNSDDIEFINNAIKTIKRRNEDVVIEPQPSSQHDELKIINAVEGRVDEQIDRKLDRIKQLLKKEIKEENEDYVDQCVAQNSNLVLASVKTQIAEELDQQKVVVERTKNELKSSIPQAVQPSNKEIDDRIEKLLAMKLEPE